mgnify:CR=1 FL=1
MVEEKIIQSSSEPQLVCPHCWVEFPISAINYVSRHFDLLGDPVLGEDEQRRFVPTRFTANGHALDARGLECIDKACPRCHLVIPESFIDFPAMFFSIVGAPSSGKSYFLTSMTHRLRQVMPKRLDVLFDDASPTINSVLNEYEERLFFNSDPEALVGLPKTELQGDSFSNHVRLDDMDMELPRPVVFLTRLAETHHRHFQGGQIPNHNLVFYDNAGEHFQPGRDSVVNPATQHLRKSTGIIFVFDPTADKNMRPFCCSEDPQLQGEGKVFPQQRLFREMVERLRKYSRMTASEKYPYPIVINVDKYDVWRSLLDFDLASVSPWFYDEAAMRWMIDGQNIMRVSYAVREIMLEFNPELVHAAESFCNKVYFIPTSALGGSPELLAGGTGGTGGSGLGVRPGNVSPVWVEMPALLLLEPNGYVHMHMNEDAAAGDIAPDGAQLCSPENCKWVENKIMLSVPGHDDRIIVPKMYCGAVVRHKASGQWLNIPSMTEKAVVLEDDWDAFWDD